MHVLLENSIRLCRFDVAVLLSFVIIACRIIHRLFFHPLSSFPGPRLAAISSYYKTYYEIVKGGALLDQINHLHSVYGTLSYLPPASA